MGLGPADKVFLHDAVILPVRPVEDVEHIPGDRERPQYRVDDKVPDNPDGGRCGQFQPPRRDEGVQPGRLEAQVDNGTATDTSASTVVASPPP